MQTEQDQRRPVVRQHLNMRELFGSVRRHHERQAAHQRPDEEGMEQDDNRDPDQMSARIRLTVSVR